jgi:hypothetical protein
MNGNRRKDDLRRSIDESFSRKIASVASVNTGVVREVKSPPKCVHFHITHPACLESHASDDLRKSHKYTCNQNATACIGKLGVVLEAVCLAFLCASGNGRFASFCHKTVREKAYFAAPSAGQCRPCGHCQSESPKTLHGPAADGSTRLYTAVPGVTVYVTEGL